MPWSGPVNSGSSGLVSRSFPEPTPLEFVHHETSSLPGEALRRSRIADGSAGNGPRETSGIEHLRGRQLVVQQPKESQSAVAFVPEVANHVCHDAGGLAVRSDVGGELLTLA